MTRAYVTLFNPHHQVTILKCRRDTLDSAIDKFCTIRLRTTHFEGAE